MKALPDIESRCEAWLAEQVPADAAHDLGHIRRVVANCRQLSDTEDADARVTLPAAWLHDCVAIAKNSPDRSQGSRLAAQAAIEFLKGEHFPADLLDEVYHAIEAHSFSAAIPPQTLEARVVQDADRLDSLGAIGIARCLIVGGKLDRPLYDPGDPFCKRREPDDNRYSLDHFYVKLLKLPDMMQTDSGRAEAHQRVNRMERWLDELDLEIGSRSRSTYYA